jgi:hypothetical protein
MVHKQVLGGVHMEGIMEKYFLLSLNFFLLSWQIDPEKNDSDRKKIKVRPSLFPSDFIHRPDLIR